MYVVPRQLGSGLGSIDLSTFTWEDYLLIGGGLLGLYFLTEGAKKQAKRKRSAKQGFAGGLVTAAVVVGGGYLAYQYYLANTANPVYPPLPIPPAVNP